MKLKQEFVLRNIAGEYILIPITGIDAPFDGIISLNETGVFIWKQIESGKSEDEIVQALLEEYDVAEEKASEDVEKLCGQLRKLCII